MLPIFYIGNPFSNIKQEADGPQRSPDKAYLKGNMKGNMFKQISLEKKQT